MSVTALRLVRFRGFHDVSIELKPLTVMLGPNSAGKSSFGQALAALSHSHRYYRGAPQPSLTPVGGHVDEWPIDLGSAPSLRTSGTKGPVQIGVRTANGWIDLGFGYDDPKSPNLELTYLQHPLGEDKSAVDVSNSAVAATPPDPRTTTQAAPITTRIATASDAFEVNRVGLEQWQDPSGKPASVLMDGMLVRSYQYDTRTARALSSAARDDFANFLDTLIYLRANRMRPARAYVKGIGRYQAIGYGGEWATSVLLDKARQTVAHMLPPKVPNSMEDMEDARGAASEWQRNEDALADALDAWFAHLGLARSIKSVAASHLSGIELKVTLPEQTAHDITDVGFGLSQVFPVVLAGLLQPKGSWFVVDLPEAHLHPKPQGKLADFFCALALSGRFSLIETHSEMFFHRLRLRAAMTPELLDHIAVYFIDEPKEGMCSVPRPVGLSFDDELRWPEGFLLEAWESEAQLTAVRKAKHIL